MTTKVESGTQPATPPTSRTLGLWAYFLVGIYFGTVLAKGQIVSWFRIQEMFRLQGFYMFGIFATAVPTAALAIALVRRYGRAVTGEPIEIPRKELGKGIRYVAGGGIFGVGMALTGACPGPQFALLGAGVWAMLVVVAAALVGTWVYGYLRPKLPH